MTSTEPHHAHARWRIWADNLARPEVWAVRLYRISHRLWHHRRCFLARAVASIGQVLSGAEIDPAAEIGHNFRLAHSPGVVIGKNAVVGNGCHIRQCVTLGARGESEAMPRIGNNVNIGAGAILLGPITVGDGAWIGAGAIVLCDVPPGCVAVGNPARILPPKEQRASTHTPKNSPTSLRSSC